MRKSSDGESQVRKDQKRGVQKNIQQTQNDCMCAYMDGHVHKEMSDNMTTKTFIVVISGYGGLFPSLYFDVFEFLQ